MERAIRRASGDKEDSRMSEHERFGTDAEEDEREKASPDVEAHKASPKMGEPEERFETDEPDVEGHMLGDKFSAGKTQP
jgi:hypothetical protein